MPGIIDARARYRSAAQRLRNTALDNSTVPSAHSPNACMVLCFGLE